MISVWLTVVSQTNPYKTACQFIQKMTAETQRRARAIWPTVVGQMTLYKTASPFILEMTAETRHTATAIWPTVVSQMNLYSLPVPASVKQLRQGRWHTAEELYNLITHPMEVNTDVPPGDKSNCYLLVNNERNMNRISSGKNKKVGFLR